jgi:adenosylcobyric acid synthase
MANFTDFDALALEPSVSLAFLDDAEAMTDADVVIIPGSKQTLDDLEWLAHKRFVDALRRRHDGGVPIIGICGGFQMLGGFIDDPSGVENGGRPRRCAGLGLLRIGTVLQEEKTVRRVQGRLQADFFGLGFGAETHFEGYEIHVGETIYESGTRPFAEIIRQESPGAVPDGAVSPSGRVIGTYVHGLFDRDDFRRAFVESARAAAGLAPAESWACVTAEREARIDRWANHLRQALDLHLIKSWLVEPPRLSERQAV